MADTLWEPFENNLHRWVDDVGGNIIRDVTSLEQEQQIIDGIRATNPAGIPWSTAEESPYVDGLAATVHIPPHKMERAKRIAVRHGLKFDVNTPWHVEPLGLREGVLKPPGVKANKYLSKSIADGNEGIARGFDRVLGEMHYGDQEVMNASSETNNRRIPIDEASKKFLRVMGSITSNNNYSAVDPDTGAVGRWQILPKHWDKWTEQVFGQKIPLQKDETTGVITAPDKITQDRVAAGMSQILFDKYKDWNRVAGAWRGGKAGATTAYPDDKAFKKRFNNAWLKESE